MRLIRILSLLVPCCLLGAEAQAKCWYSNDGVNYKETDPYYGGSTLDSCVNASRPGQSYGSYHVIFVLKLDLEGVRFSRLYFIRDGKITSEAAKVD